MARVRFVYRTGIRRALFDRVRLVGGWDPEGRRSDGDWSGVAMAPVPAADGG